MPITYGRIPKAFLRIFKEPKITSKKPVQVICYHTEIANHIEKLPKWSRAHLTGYIKKLNFNSIKKQKDWKEEEISRYKGNPNRLPHPQNKS